MPSTTLQHGPQLVRRMRGFGFELVRSNGHQHFEDDQGRHATFSGPLTGRLHPEHVDNLMAELRRMGIDTGWKQRHGKGLRKQHTTERATHQMAPTNDTGSSNGHSGTTTSEAARLTALAPVTKTPGTLPEKWCPRCKRLKPRSAFGMNRSKSDGLQVWCKACVSVKPESVAAAAAPEPFTRVTQAEWDALGQALDAVPDTSVPAKAEPEAPAEAAPTPAPEPAAVATPTDGTLADWLGLRAVGTWFVALEHGLGLEMHQAECTIRMTSGDSPHTRVPLDLVAYLVEHMLDGKPKADAIHGVMLF